MASIRRVDPVLHRVSAQLPNELLIWGTVQAEGETILTAGADETLELSFELTKPLPAGHKLEVWSHFVSDMGRGQLADPVGAAYFSFEAPVAATAFVCPEAKVHGPGSYFPYRRYAGITLCEDAPVGSHFSFRIADVSMQTYEETLFNLRIAIMDESQVVGYLGDAFYLVKGAEATQLCVVAPTCVETGVPFDIKILTRDRYSNKSGDPLEGLRFEAVTEDGPLVFDTIAFDAGWQHHVIKNVTLGAEGTCYANVSVVGDDSICGVSNPIEVRDAWAVHVYWGDLHQHAYYHDGRGTPAANIEYAISSSCLDFLTIAPHQESTFNPPSVHLPGAPPQLGWEEMRDAAETYNGDDIVAILGSEASMLGRVVGHMNAHYLDVDNLPEFERMGLFFTSEERIGGAMGDPTTFYARYLAELERSKGEFLLLPHAHACGGPGKFDMPKLPDYQTSIEVVSVHGVFEEFYRQWLAAGHFVGVHGSGDNHMTSTGNGNPGWHYTNTNGLAAAVAGSRTRKGVFDAIRSRKTYAVTGNQRLYLEFTIDGAEMGDVVVGRDAGSRHIRFHVAGTAPVMKVELVRNNDVIGVYAPEPAERDTLRLCWTDSWGSRRVDDSLTTGTIALPGGSLAVRSLIHPYHRTDTVHEMSDGTLSYRSNAYSGTTRGAILGVAGADDDPELAFTIHDVHLDTVLLDETIPVSLAQQRTVVARRLADVERRPCFTKDPVHPELTLEADWISIGWPKVVDVEWTDMCDGDVFYYVRVEQIDGNIAWSSPIWFVSEAPARG